jgi:hypothetical protein
MQERKEIDDFLENLSLLLSHHKTKPINVFVEEGTELASIIEEYTTLEQFNKVFLLGEFGSIVASIGSVLIKHKFDWEAFYDLIDPETCDYGALFYHFTCMKNDKDCPWDRIVEKITRTPNKCMMAILVTHFEPIEKMVTMAIEANNKAVVEWLDTLDTLSDELYQQITEFYFTNAEMRTFMIDKITDDEENARQSRIEYIMTRVSELNVDEVTELLTLDVCQKDIKFIEYVIEHFKNSDEILYVLDGDYEMRYFREIMDTNDIHKSIPFLDDMNDKQAAIEELLQKFQSTLKDMTSKDFIKLCRMEIDDKVFQDDDLDAILSRFTYDELRILKANYMLGRIRLFAKKYIKKYDIADIWHAINNDLMDQKKRVRMIKKRQRLEVQMDDIVKRIRIN